MKKKKKRKILWHRYLILILGFLLILWLLIFIGFGLFRLLTKNTAILNPDSFQINENGYMTLDNNLYTTKTGIDVSSFQREIDWAKVKESGIDFAIIRCGYRGATEGILYEDSTFKQNIESALENDIEVGVYFYSTAISEKELKEEVDFVLDLIKDYPIQFPVCYDMESYQKGDRISQLTQEQRTSFALEFCSQIEKAGYESMIYGNKNWLEKELDLDQIKKENIWYAAYIEKPDLSIHFKMWQYSNSGQIDGIATNVDLNIYLE